MRLYVVYFWTSRNRYSDTRAQLEEQETEIARHVSYNQGRIAGEYLAGEYTEEDVSWRSTWPKLAEAIARTKQVQGTLIIAKADRLVHNAAFTRMLLESGVRFVCCDNREFHDKTIHIWANMAEADSRRTSARVKAGLSAAKARGVKLGSAREGHWEGREELRRAGIRKGQPKATRAAAEARSQAARDAYSGLMPLIVKMREEGLTMAEIAKRINAEGHLTRAGKPFSDSMIVRLLQRAKRTESQRTAAPPELAAEYSDPPLLRLCPDTAGAAFEAAHQ
jgi:DNA invertase Pin-like site-specific DNA recombinase